MPLYEPYVGVVKLATRRHPNPDKIIAAYATCSYDIASMQRCTARGHVLAAWSSGRFLLQDEEGYVMRVELDDPSSRPACGEFITVLGYPETDLYRINLTRAKYRPETGGSAPVQTALDVWPEELLLDSPGQRMVKPNHLGRLIRMRGRVKAVPSGLGDRKSILIESGKFLVPVDVSAKPEIANGIQIDSTIDATGICVMESQSWHPNMILPRIEKLLLVPRSAEDLATVSRPPWWTTKRLMALVGALLAALAAILAWNVSLRHMARRTARALYRAEISNAAAELRIDERTRLAAELHDSLAQNLSGITMQITACSSRSANSASTHRATARPRTYGSSWRPARSRSQCPSRTTVPGSTRGTVPGLAKGISGCAASANAPGESAGASASSPSPQGDASRNRNRHARTERRFGQMSKIKVILADDHTIARMGIAALLKYRQDIEVVG